jgi:hypothetical protein
MRTFQATMLTLGLAVIAAAQSPFTATKTLTTSRVDAQGNVTQTRSETGTYARASDGREATHMYALVNGQPTPTTAVILENGQTTQVNYQNHAYRKVANASTPQGLPQLPAQILRNPKGERRTINGISCVVIPARDRRTGQSGGFSCVSPEYGVLVHSEMEVSVEGSPVRLRIVEDVTNFQFQEPDASHFSVPAGFQATDALGPDCLTCAK